MIYVSIIGDGMVVRTHGSEDLGQLVDVVLQNMPGGFSYRFISKGMIMRLEVLSPDAYIAVWTNLDCKRHSWVIRKVLDQMDMDLNVLVSDNDDTELE